MKSIKWFFIFIFGLFFLASAGIANAQTPTTYGTLDNFDVVNDTGVETHGFEIELEGITSVADIPYFFGAPYERYGDPEIVLNSGGTGVIVRYKALYSGGTWSAGTPTVASMPPTDGHSCWTYGDPNYPNVGCDHFGISLNAVPTKTTYRWLIENPSAPGTLMVNGTNVPLPAPVWNVTPPADPAVNQPVAAAVINPILSDDPSKCGEAMWVKVYTTELPNGLQPDDLNHMVVDDPDVNIVPDENDPLQVEWEWYLLQGCPGEAANADEFGGVAEVAAGNEAVSRRFEFYKYAGQYDPDPEAINEAMCDNPLEATQQTPERCGEPNADGVAGVGGYIGKQNAAINLAGEFVVPDTAPILDPIGNKNVDEIVALNFAATATDADVPSTPLTYSLAGEPMGASIDHSTGVFTWTPTEAQGPGSYTFDVVVSDGILSDSESITVTVNEVNVAPVAGAGANQLVATHSTVTLSGSGTDVDLPANTLTYRWVLVNRPPSSKAVLSGDTTISPTFVADKDGTYVVSLIVNDGAIDSNLSTVTISANKAKKK